LVKPVRDKPAFKYKDKLLKEEIMASKSPTSIPTDHRKEVTVIEKAKIFTIN